MVFGSIPTKVSGHRTYFLQLDKFKGLNLRKTQIRVDVAVIIQTSIYWYKLMFLKINLLPKFSILEVVVMKNSSSRNEYLNI